MACLQVTVSCCTILTNHSPPVSVPNCGYPNSVTKHHHSSLTSMIRFSLSSPSRTRRVLRGQQVIIKAAAEENMTTTTQKLGINVQTNPSESKLSELGVRNWPKFVSASLSLYTCLYMYRNNVMFHRMYDL